MERRATRTRTTLAVSLLALTLIAPWALGQDLTETRRLAEQGDADAQFNLGVMYANGEGVPQDEAEAVRWYRLAQPNRGTPVRSTTSGSVTPTARASRKDEAEAVRWYRLAQPIRVNADPRKISLGVSYSNGDGCSSKDEAEAVRWYRLAQPIRGTPVRAVQPRGQVRHRHGRPAGRGRSRALVSALSRSRERRCAEPPRGQLLPRRGCPQDEAEAVRWYRLSADQGNASAQYIASGSVTPTARVSSRTRPKPCVGIGSQPIRGTPLRKITSGSVTPTARVSSRTRPKPCVGIGSQPIRGTPLRSSTSGSGTPTARVVLKDRG